MNLKNYKPLASLLLVIATSYLLHKVLFYSLEIDQTSFHYTLEQLYIFFAILSIMVIAILLKVKERSFDNVGMSFLLSTSIKMVVCFLLLKPILQATTTHSGVEKKNFFGMFILFLAIETVLTIRLLNKNQ